MLEEFEFHKRDSIRLYFLKEAVKERTVKFGLFLESDGKEKDFLTIRGEGKEKYRFNNFDVIENPGDNSITFSPNVIGCFVYFSIQSNEPLRAEYIEKGKSIPSRVFELRGKSRLDFKPLQMKKYDLSLSTEEPSREDMEKSWSTELNKDYKGFKEELENLQEKYRIDQEILDLYAVKELAPIEELLQKANEAIEKVECQVRSVIEAQERRRAEIEKRA